MKIRKIMSLVLVLILAMGIVACGTNKTTEDQPANETTGKTQDGETIKIAMLPKFKGENYFDAAKVGAEECVEELNKDGKKVELLYDGPPQDQATNQKQIDIIEGWIGQGVDVILLSPNDPTAIAETLLKAQKQGISVVTFDADSQTDARQLFVNQVDPSGVAKGLLDGAAGPLKEAGYGADKTANIALISSSKTDANQQSWLEEIKKLLETPEYNWMVINNEDTDVYYPGPDETATQSDAATLISRLGSNEDQIQAAIGLTSMATPALGAQYEAASVKPDPKAVVMTGLATPNAIKSYIKDDSNPMYTGVLWNVMDLGYLAVQTGYQLSTGEITADSSSINAGRLNDKEIADQIILLGPALVFNKDDIDNFDY